MGKSAFVYRWLAQLADARLGKRTPPAWATPDTLPILITLRDLIGQLNAIAAAELPDGRCRQALAAAAHEQMVKDLARLYAADFEGDLLAALHSGDCLLALDGLDEVPQRLRGLAKETVLALLAAYGLRRLIVTCRIRSYVDEAQLEHFEHYTLAGFNREQIRGFARAWYSTRRKLNRLTDEQAQAKAENLAAAAVDDDLIELASNPMLLTTLASIHQREAALPRERVRLYDAAVRNLLFRWQKSKLEMSGALARFVDSNEIRDAMELLAFHTHGAGQKDREAADLSRGQAIELLEKVLKDLDTVNEFLQYVDHRAGLLIGAGSEPDRPERYRFPHRTFQEYLAGCYLVRQTHPHRRSYPLAAQGDYWSLAAQLGAEELYFTRRLTPTALEGFYSKPGAGLVRPGKSLLLVSNKRTSVPGGM